GAPSGRYQAAASASSRARSSSPTRTARPRRSCPSRAVHKAATSGASSGSETRAARAPLRPRPAADARTASSAAGAGGASEGGGGGAFRVDCKIGPVHDDRAADGHLRHAWRIAVSDTDGALLDELTEFLKIPSISSGGGDPADIDRAAEWARQKIVAAGGTAE